MKRILIILAIVVNCTLLIDNCQSQWVQQSVPVTAGYFNDMQFVNANTGFIAQYSYPVGTFLKTTNAGYNWTVNLNAQIQNISVVDSLNIYCTVNRGLYDKLFKTTNCGISWDSSLTTSLYLGYLRFFNKDTGMISIGDGSNNYIARITDGGQSYQIIATYGGASAGKFFFLKEKINGEYYGWMYYPNGNMLRYTTNSGLVWYSHPILTQWRNYQSIFFINQNIGWATTYGYSNNILYTTNGGNNWSDKYMPNTYSIFWYDLFFLNQLTGWIGSDLNNVLLITTNGGNNWGTQSIPGGASANINFVDSLNGWAQTSYNTLVHTTNGGGTITSIISGSTETQKDYRLFQNYPNPFNPITNVKFSILNAENVKIIVYDVMGREVQTLVDERLQPGKYEARFDGSMLNSGIYFYKLIANGFTETKKMLLLK